MVGLALLRAGVARSEERVSGTIPGTRRMWWKERESAVSVQDDSGVLRWVGEVRDTGQISCGSLPVVSKENPGADRGQSGSSSAVPPRRRPRRQQPVHSELTSWLQRVHARYTARVASLGACPPRVVAARAMLHGRPGAACCLFRTMQRVRTDGTPPRSLSQQRQKSSPHPDCDIFMTERVHSPAR